MTDDYDDEDYFEESDFIDDYIILDELDRTGSRSEGPSSSIGCLPSIIMGIIIFILICKFL